MISITCHWQTRGNLTLISIREARVWGSSERHVVDDFFRPARFSLPPCRPDSPISSGSTTALDPTGPTSDKGTHRSAGSIPRPEACPASPTSRRSLPCTPRWRSRVFARTIWVDPSTSAVCFQSRTSQTFLLPTRRSRRFATILDGTSPRPIRSLPIYLRKALPRT